MKNTFTLYNDDCLIALKKLPDNSVDSCVTDPPYGLSFMSKKWDYDVPKEEIWQEVLRVLKPGGHLLAFAGTRTQHRMAVRIEDAGFEIRDMIAWVYGSGFPKSHDFAGAVVETDDGQLMPITKAEFIGHPQSVGWGTALKPALEPITVARKPLIGTVADNVLAHGTGAINIDGCRVDSGGTHGSAKSSGQGAGRATANHNGSAYGKGLGGVVAEPHSGGRWPANLIHDGSEDVTRLFPISDSARANGNPNNPKRGTNHTATSYGQGDGKVTHDYRDTGSAARFFYCAKASKSDREDDNNHPTVKPTALMQYLCRLVTPPNGIVLDPFMGSGSTGKAAAIENFNFIGIEMDEKYFDIAKARVYASYNNRKQSLKDFIND